MMEMIMKLIKTKETHVTFEQLVAVVTGKKHYEDFHFGIAMQVLSHLAKENRWELFGTYAGYKIITDGAGNFKHFDCQGKKVNNLYLLKNAFMKMNSFAI